MEKKELFLNTQPDSNEVWEELGGNYENAMQIINEFADNAVSNIIGNKTRKKLVQITLEQTNNNDGDIIISIEDSGVGISNVEDAFTLGKTGTDSVLNEHGFGLIQSLAAANKQNDSWDAYKRSDIDLKKDEIIHVSAPYVMGKLPYEKLDNSKWPGHEWGRTLISVRCASRLFLTLMPVEEAVRSVIKLDFNVVADRIYEDLGFTYSYLLSEKKIEMYLVLKKPDGAEKEYKVSPIIPKWITQYEEEDPRLHLKCKYGQITKLPDRIPFDNSTSSIYYKGNLISSGAEIRINGRAMEHNKFEEIFGKFNHPKFNSFLAQIDIVSDSREFLPETRTTKNGFRVGDQRLQDIYKWIRGTIIPLQKKHVKPVSVTERAEKSKLAEIIETQFEEENTSEPEKKENITSREVEVFCQILNRNRPKIDILVKKSENACIIEAKKEAAGPIDLYQLLMYCDGYFLDKGKMPEEAILVAKKFPEGMYRILSYINEKNKGKYPEIIFKFWNEYMENFEETLIEEKKAKMKY